MPILNYTTKVSVDRTCTEIQKALAKCGATKIVSDYDSDGEVAAISFQIMVDGMVMGYTLPNNWQNVLQVMNKQAGVLNHLKNNDQAKRVAWRIVKDWVEAQLAIIQARVVTLDQVMLPYAVTNNGQSYYERLKGERFYLAQGSER